MLDINSNRIPQNDQELNLCVQAMNRAYGKYFNFNIGENRSNKLRDCYCESIGFTNGAYQQLQAYWNAMNSYDFTSMTNVSALIFEFDGGYEAVIARPIAGQVTNYLCHHFPNDSEGFLDEEGLYLNDLEGAYNDVEQAAWEDYGWDLLVHTEGCEDILKKEKSAGNWFPLYYGNIIIGFAFSKEHQQMMNGLLLSCYADNGIDFKTSTTLVKIVKNKDWNKYLESQSLTTPSLTGKYIALRMSSMESSLYLPFDELILDEGKAILTKGIEETHIEYNKQNKTFILNNIEFDFLSVYYFGEDNTLLDLTIGSVDLGGAFTFSGKSEQVEYAELFCYDRLEYRLEDDDDVSSVNHLEGAAFLIK